MGGPLEGLRVIDLTTTLAGVHISQTLCDFGCDVVMVEPPGGHPLRDRPAWPFWGRGKRSLVLDLHDSDDLAVARSLIAGADVVVETWRPGEAEALGLGYEGLSADNPRLVYASLTAFGRDNPLSDLKPYEPVVMAKIGALDAFALLADRPGPKYVSSPYTSFSGSQLALQGVLAALYEREISGRGQHVETTMVQGILAHDTWNWMTRLITQRFPEAFSPQNAASTTQGTGLLVPNSPLFLRLMVGFSKDGKYMQFSQMSDRLFHAFLTMMDLERLIDDPDFAAGMTPDDPVMRVKWQETATERTRSKTYDEWLAEFDREPNVWAEMFRDGSELLHHPQLVHDGRTLVLDDPAVGPVLQPGPLAVMSATPAIIDTPAPAIDADADTLRAEAGRPHTAVEPSSPAAAGAPPLAGLTLVEFGTYYAAPFGATLLADLGVRVIKIEQIGGDPIRTQVGFPEIGGVKVLQGKESVAVDITSDAGKEIVYELVRRADIVLQSFRAGVAERHGYTSDDLLKINPDLVYLNAPGYGTGPPHGHRPAFAPTIGAGSGLAYRNVGGRDNVPSDPSLDMQDVRQHAGRLGLAMLSVGHADGFSSLGVGTALMLGVLAKRLGSPGQAMGTSMLSTMAHCLSEDMVEYDGRAALARADKDLFGLGPRYRLYETSDGWIFLAAPEDAEWDALADELGLPDELKDDDALASVLVELFRGAASAAWESRLRAVDVMCVEVAKGPVEEAIWFSGGLGEMLGIVTEVQHALFDAHPRLKPMVTFSRSRGVAGAAPLCGAHTDPVLRELGYSDERIAGLRANGDIG
jgi:crotonobetainyl-CoA:carnitine CoA-transferase CaiB-like acyl-CoA transferase